MIERPRKKPGSESPAPLAFSKFWGRPRSRPRSRGRPVNPGHFIWRFRPSENNETSFIIICQPYLNRIKKVFVNGLQKKVPRKCVLMQFLDVSLPFSDLCPKANFRGRPDPGAGPGCPGPALFFLPQKCQSSDSDSDPGAGVVQTLERGNYIFGRNKRI